MHNVRCAEDVGRNRLTLSRVRRHFILSRDLRGLFLAEAIQPHHFGALARLGRLVLAFGGGLGAATGRAEGAGTAGRFAAGASAAASAGSNCRPNCTDGSKKLLIASNGTTSRSGMPPNDRPTSKRSSVTTRSQNWCCRMIGHLFRILRQQPRRQLHALGGGQEGDEEMMLAGQAVLGGVGQHAAQHAAQRVARQHVVSDMIGRHGRSCRVQMLPRIGAPVAQLALLPPCYPGGGPRSAGVTAMAEFAAERRRRPGNQE